MTSDTRQDFKSLQEGVQKYLVAAVKTANRVAAEDLSFQRTVHPDAATHLDEKSARLLRLSTKLLQAAGSACGVKAPKLEDAEDIEMKWQGIVDVVDSVLEKADTALDEYTGLIKRRDPVSEAASTKKPKSTNKVIRNANVVKPQLSFQLKPDNFPTGPWKPILTSKPHASVAFQDSFSTTKDESGEQYQHPYVAEITQMTYPDQVYEVAEPIMYQPVDTTTATWVDTYEGVLDMLKHLKKAKEIAVDLEHHDFRTYTGLVSLMQVSTRDQDWIVDTLQPWRHKLEVLNEVFADPSIIKVFHGAYMDMIWLQRDLGLYVNCLFDTFFACEQLYSGRSLAFLLSKFVNFDADKQYQLADWRIRPIPEEMLYYARSDTHYLLYIYDRVRNDLVSSSDRSNPELDYIGIALQRSKELSLSRHVHADYNEETGEGPRGWYNYVLKHSHLAYNGVQFAVFQAIWKWRDTLARKEDESPNFVLGTTNVAEIARVNPPDAKALHSLLPLTAPLARQRVNAIWDCVQEAQSKGGPSLLQFFAVQAPEGVTKAGFKGSREVTALPDLDGAVAANRLSKSKLFGDMPISSIWDGSKLVNDVQESQIPFPWQKFVESMEDLEETEAVVVPEVPTADVLEITPAQTPTAPAKRAQPEPIEDEEFTLKKGKKRKSDVTEEESESDDDDDDEEEEDGDEDMTGDGVIDVDDEAAQQKAALLAKKERKRIKKERRQLAEQRREAKKQKKSEQQETTTKRYDAVPFDYSQASSVLHASRSAAKDKEGDRKDRKKKKAFNPYAKSSDDGAIKGARKPMPIRGERSATFKK
ncbi:hypothetical protein VHEMI10462 [[Torrubiella] hemipterigena]|uniref:HRDC domain-containing protein n=1 Tax=[Torrubiella] hemipterigena TaxID=1531966 RepID=A0A0A1TIT2_9HYPO|nr:hypothetical protein VHEMI10462 [[Torrubiella] hemipterigena]